MDQFVQQELPLKTFTQKELEAGFKLIKPKSHWKDPINSQCEESEIELVRASIIFFTATVPKFTLEYFRLPVDLGRFKKGQTIYKVESVGYRLGPAGDH